MQRRFNRLLQTPLPPAAAAVAFPLAEVPVMLAFKHPSSHNLGTALVTKLDSTDKNLSSYEHAWDFQTPQGVRAEKGERINKVARRESASGDSRIRAKREREVEEEEDVAVAVNAQCTK